MQTRSRYAESLLASRLPIDSMKLVIRDDVDALAAYAANEIAKTINVAKNAGKQCVLGLPVGQTMLKTYAKLASDRRPDPTHAWSD
jgi:6-phosphogluconolactonase/glucosamine-6-phosphate isomerase/deaminase